jgi:hypothetical protein
MNRRARVVWFLSRSLLLPPSPLWRPPPPFGRPPPPPLHSSPFTLTLRVEDTQFSIMATLSASTAPSWVCAKRVGRERRSVKLGERAGVSVWNEVPDSACVGGGVPRLVRLVPSPRGLHPPPLSLQHATPYLAPGGAGREAGDQEHGAAREGDGTARGGLHIGCLASFFLSKLLEGGRVCCVPSLRGSLAEFSKETERDDWGRFLEGMGRDFGWRCETGAGCVLSPHAVFCARRVFPSWCVPRTPVCPLSRPTTPLPSQEKPSQPVPRPSGARQGRLRRLSGRAAGSPRQGMRLGEGARAHHHAAVSSPPPATPRHRTGPRHPGGSAGPVGCLSL